jgi:DNA-directed RNA polymerase specialized sigma24 family protein
MANAPAPGQKRGGIVDFRDWNKEERRRLYELVLATAYRITKSREKADEITQESFLRLMTTRTWDEGKQPSLERHMLGIVKSLVSHERASKRRDYESRGATELAVISVGAAPSPQERLLDRAARDGEEAVAARRVEALRTKLGSRELELAICDLVAEGVKKPADLAPRLERPVGEVNDALERIRRYMKSIVAAERGIDEEVT